MNVCSDFHFDEVDMFGCSQMVGYRSSLFLQSGVYNVFRYPGGDVTAHLAVDVHLTTGT
jgi:hypothetical protein